MSIPLIKSSFVSGELSPSIFGHVDLARFPSGASTMRNLWPSYRGGAYSRAGTAFVGYSKQTGRNYPARLITFQFSINQGLGLEFGNLYMRVIRNGAYVTETPINITAISQANPAVVTAANTFANGDWVFISGAQGMTQVNGQTFVVANAAGTQFSLSTIFGLSVDSTTFSAYTGGGAVARIYTLTTIYGEADLAYLKFAESADVMSICCVNQITLTEYPQQDLTRNNDTNWSFAIVNSAPVVAPPASAAAQGSAAGNVFYQYQVTAVSPVDGSESIASPIAYANEFVDISATAGSVTINWAGVPNVNEYNVYKATPQYNGTAPSGVLFGFIGSAYGTSFIDKNITSDFTEVPPQHKNPFARGQILGVTMTNGGAGATSVVPTINTTTGSGAILLAVITNGAVVAFITEDAGHDYAPTDTITITTDGSVQPTGVLNVGPVKGTYPSTVAYFQQRRVYANTENAPDTYFMSQPGSYTNFDSRIPTVDTDAIIGTPWAQKVDGIQFMVSMPGGLVVLAGINAWQLTGVGGSSLNPQPITPANQQAQPQAFNGCSATVPPIKIDDQIVYLQAKGSIYRAFQYQYFQNIYTGDDLSQNSGQLFTGYTIREHAWTEEPYKILWSVRNDGVMLSLTLLKSQQVMGWARHDTNGLFQSVCSVTEPPVDALYMVVQRVLGGQTVYTVERMDDRIWSTVESCWCVDCGLAAPQPAPNATINANSTTGLGAISGVTNLVGGSGYSGLTTATVVDDEGNGPGIGATVALAIVGGVITSVTFPNRGTGYTFPRIVFQDPAGSAGGSGASATLILDNTTTFSTSTAVFQPGDVGKVLRMGGGIALVTSYINAQSITGNMLSPIVSTYPDGAGNPVAQPQTSGNWTLTTPITTVQGLYHLAGMTVTGLADGNVITPRVVAANGSLVLDAPASAITIGLGYQAQLQSVYLDAGEPTVQGQRKKIAEVTARVESSRGILIGSNQPDGSVQSPMQTVMQWKGMNAAPDLAKKPYNGLTVPLYTGDVRIPVGGSPGGGWNKRGQVALQQNNPLPLQVLDLVPQVLSGDTPESRAAPRQQARQ